MIPFHAALILWRYERGLTQAQLAKAVGLPRPNLSDLERGERDCTIGTLRAIAASLGIKPGILVDGIPPGGKARHSLTRRDLERVANNVWRPKGKGPISDKVLVRCLRMVIPECHQGQRISNQAVEKAWLWLRAVLDPTQLESLIHRIREKGKRDE